MSEATVDDLMTFAASFLAGLVVSSLVVTVLSFVIIGRIKRFVERGD